MTELLAKMPMYLSMYRKYFVGRQASSKARLVQLDGKSYLKGVQYKRYFSFERFNVKD